MSDYKEVPANETYKVRFEKCFNTMSKAGNPMMTAWYRITDGQYKGCILFQHQVRTTEVGNRIAQEVLDASERYGIGGGAQSFELYYRKKDMGDGRVYDQFFIND